MYRLADKHAGELALVFFGGPSVLVNNYPVGNLADKKFRVFLESKALTPKFLDYGLPVDYYFMPYPEKCKSTAFQMVVYQAKIADIDLSELLLPEMIPEYEFTLSVFDRFFDRGTKPNVPHKKYIWKPDVYFRGSPFDLLPQLKDADLISYDEPFSRFVKTQKFEQDVYPFTLDVKEGEFDLEDYYSPKQHNGKLEVSYYRTTNSAAVALFPMLQHLGFKEVYFLGFDMSMLGSMEYSAPFTFRSMKHFSVFFEQTRGVFSATFPRSSRADCLDEMLLRYRQEGIYSLGSPDMIELIWKAVVGKDQFGRPRQESRDLASALSWPDIRFVNVYEPYEYASPVPGIENISFEQLMEA